MATIRLPASLSAGMPGTELRNRNRRAVCRFAPRGCICAAPDHCSPARLLAVSDQDRLVTAAFHSPASNACFQATVAGSMLPACCFLAAPVFPGGRSVSPLLRPPRFAPATVGIIAMKPVLPFRTCASGCSPALRSPSGYLSLRDQSFDRLSTGKSTFRTRPLVFRSPQPPF